MNYCYSKSKLDVFKMDIQINWKISGRKHPREGAGQQSCKKMINITNWISPRIIWKNLNETSLLR